MQPGHDGIVRQLDELVQQMEAAVEHDYQGTEYIADSQARHLLTRAMAAIDRLAPLNSAYFREAEKIQGHASYAAYELKGIVKALRDDYRSGAMQSVTELVHADLFDDFLELASELASKGFHPPAAVVAGSVLEEQLRKLAEKSKIATVDAKGRPKSVDALGTALVKVGIFSEAQRKFITSWYGQRTEAAHGRIDGVIADEVDRMIDGVRDFVVRYPA